MQSLVGIQCCRVFEDVRCVEVGVVVSVPVGEDDLAAIDCQECPPR